MYILYYLNDNYQMGTIEVETLDAPIRIPENLIFTNLRKDINFEREPHKCIAFTHLERLIMSTEFFDMETIKQSDFRKANTYLEPLCQIDPYDIVLIDSEVKYFNDEGNVLIFPLHADLPNELTNAFLSLDGVNFQRAGIEHDDNGFNWGGIENRLYYSSINGILFPAIDLVGSPVADLPHYVYFQNVVNGKRTKVHTITNP